MGKFSSTPLVRYHLIQGQELAESQDDVGCMYERTTQDGESLSLVLVPVLVLWAQ